MPSQTKTPIFTVFPILSTSPKPPDRSRVLGFILLEQARQDKWKGIDE
jgi:hypothetical protein